MIALALVLPFPACGQQLPPALRNPPAPLEAGRRGETNARNGPLAAAERALVEADRLRVGADEASLRRAVLRYEAARAAFHAAGDVRGETVALRALAEIRSLVGAHVEALASGNEALRLSRAAEDLRGEIDALNILAACSIATGDNREALEHSSLALRLSREARYVYGEAQALTNSGESYYDFSDLRKALDHLESALAIWRSLNDSQGLARTLGNLGYVYTDLSEIDKGISLFEESLMHWRQAGSLRGQGRTLTAIGLAYSYLGENQKALEYHGRAVDLCRVAGDAFGEAVALNGIAYLYSDLGDAQRSLDAYTRALERFRRSGNRIGEAVNLGSIGEIYASQAKFNEAVAHYEQALAISREVGDKRLEAHTLKRFGEAYMDRGDASKALSYFDLALTLSRAARDRREEADVLDSIGSIHEHAGRADDALVHYQEALSLYRATQDRGGEASALFSAARVQRSAGDLDGARSGIEAALQIVESRRSKIASHALRASYLASVYQQYEFYIDLLMRMHMRNPEAGFDAIALCTSERARARWLLETLAEARGEVRQGVDPAFLRREQALRQALNAKAARQTRLLSGDYDEAEARVLAREVRELTAEYDVVCAEARATSPRYAALAMPVPLDLAEIRERVLLDDDSTLLEYALGEERSYAWVVTRGSLSSYELPGREAIEALARPVYELLTARQVFPGEPIARYRVRSGDADARLPAAATALSEAVLGPVAGHLRTGRVLVVADGALNYVPFEALPVPGTSTGELMIDRNEIVNLPSASALAALRTDTKHRVPASGEVAILADPVFDRDDPRVKPSSKDGKTAAKRGMLAADLDRALRDVATPGIGISRLPSTRREADAIVGLAPGGVILKALGFDANREMATGGELSRYRIVHFATHGLLDSEHPELSGIVLSLVDERGRPRDGFLRLNDIYNLDLPAELVVLSACNTGLGQAIRGEGLVGLTRGFMFAGARRVVASLWRVDDEATAELMRRFYAAMLESRQEPAAALRAAKLAMRHQKRWRAPYFWAGFVLQGEYN